MLEPPRRGGSKNRLGEVVLTCTHSLCFGAKIRKIGIPQFCYIKVGYHIRRYILHGHVILCDQAAIMVNQEIQKSI